jgi:hypothetical protein
LLYNSLLAKSHEGFLFAGCTRACDKSLSTSRQKPD